MHLTGYTYGWTSYASVERTIYNVEFSGQWCQLNFERAFLFHDVEELSGKLNMLRKGLVMTTD